MTAPANPLKRAIAAGDRQIGLMCNLASPYAVEVVAGAGFDWLLIDTEHSPAGIENVLGQLQAVQGHGPAPVVRVPWNDLVSIKRHLDIGAQSLLIPYVEDAAQASRAVAATRYPPAGVRGVALTTRASGFGRREGYAAAADDEIAVIVQIENEAGLGNIEEISATDGVDALFIGPSDLHASFGRVGESAHPEVVAVIDDAIRRIVVSGKAAGVFAPVEDLAERWMELGASLVLVGSDISILARGADRLATRHGASGE